MANLPKAPTLDELKSRPFSLEEQQAALIKLIELHNALAEAVYPTIGSVQSSLTASRQKAVLFTLYGNE